MNIVIEGWMVWLAIIVYTGANYVHLRDNIILIINDIGRLL